MLRQEPGDTLGHGWRQQVPAPVDVACDAQGRVASVSEPYHATATPTRHRTTYAYDHCGRVTTEGRPDGGSVSTKYVRHGNGVLVTRTETVVEAGKANVTQRRTTLHNVLGELVRATDAAGNRTAVAGPNFGRVTFG